MHSRSHRAATSDGPDRSVSAGDYRPERSCDRPAGSVETGKCRVDGPSAASERRVPSGCARLSSGLLGTEPDESLDAPPSPPRSPGRHCCRHLRVGCGVGTDGFPHSIRRLEDSVLQPWSLYINLYSPRKFGTDTETQ